MFDIKWTLTVQAADTQNIPPITYTVQDIRKPEFYSLDIPAKGKPKGEEPAKPQEVELMFVPGEEEVALLLIKPDKTNPELKYKVNDSSTLLPLDNVLFLLKNGAKMLFNDKLKKLTFSNNHEEQSATITILIGKSVLTPDPVPQPAQPAQPANGNVAAPADATGATSGEGGPATSTATTPSPSSPTPTAPATAHIPPPGSTPQHTPEQGSSSSGYQSGPDSVRGQ